MIKIENPVFPSPVQWNIVTKGMRNAMNSWDRSDSCIIKIVNPKTLNEADFDFFMGDNDESLAMRLSEGGGPHAKYRRMLPIYVDITAPLYWWKEFDTYKIGTVANSCSTMHKIHAKEFDISDFSTDHLIETNIEILNEIIKALNTARKNYILSNDKKYWWQLIQLLPSSYNQKRTVMFNYEVAGQMHKWRKDHKLDEWREFCKWLETIPHSELFVGE